MEKEIRKEEKKEDKKEEPAFQKRPVLKYEKYVPIDSKLTSEEQTELEKTIAFAFDNFTVESEIASFIKDRLDALYKKNWHCIVGIIY